MNAKKPIINLLAIMISFFNACGQSYGPGYDFELFENTPIEQLATAVKNDDKKEISRLLETSRADVNYQEQKYGNTLLHIAVATGRLKSAQALLSKHASITLRDSMNFTAIHEATFLGSRHKNGMKILQLLLRYGANPNDHALKMSGVDTTTFYIPLLGARKNLECAKLLLANGADPYVQFHASYVCCLLGGNQCRQG